MSVVSPSNLVFNYNKWGVAPPYQLVTHRDTLNLVDWYVWDPYDNIGVNDPAFILDIQEGSFKAAISTDIWDFSDKPPGTYYITIKLRFEDETALPNPYPLPWDIETQINITLNYSWETLLEVSPTSLTYNFTIGGSTPPNKTITITTANNWTLSKNQSWLLLPTPSGSGNGTFSVGVDTTGLAANTYTDVITVDDGDLQQTIAVNLIVTESDTSTDFLYVTPALLQFGMNIGGTLPNQQYIELDASGAWTASADQTWVNIITSSGGAGANLVPIALQNVESLEAGTYFANISFTLADIIKTVVLQFTVYNVSTQLLEEGELYFTDDENTLILASGRSDTFMRLDFTTIYNAAYYNTAAEVPFFKGKSEKRIGERAKVIIGKQPFFNIAQPSLFQPYLTLSLNIAITELELFTKNTVQTLNISNIKFIKGTTPPNNWLTTLPSKVFFTKNATIYLSLLTNGTQPSTIEITGAHTKTYNFTAFDADFVTAVIPLSDIGVLNVGDVLNISILNNTIQVVIKEETQQQTQVFFENEWGCWDCLEFTGDLTISDEFQRKTSTVRKSELYTETKIIDVSKPMVIDVNTGDMHTDENIEALSALLQSNNVYIFTNNQVIQVNPETKKLNLYSTRREARSFDLKFKNVIE